MSVEEDGDQGNLRRRPFGEKAMGEEGGGRWEEAFSALGARRKQWNPIKPHPFTISSP